MRRRVDRFEVLSMLAVVVAAIFVLAAIWGVLPGAVWRWMLGAVR